MAFNGKLRNGAGQGKLNAGHGQKVRDRHSSLLMAVLVIVTSLAYMRVVHNGFIAFDDNIYIYENPVLQKGLTWEGIRYAFGFSTGTYWHPITWISLMIDHDLFGLNPAGYHIENLLLHCINVLLLFNLLKQTTGKLLASAFVAALFALHPLNVESVAWAVERKTVLSSMFFFLAILAYVRYARRPALSRFIAVALVMAVGLMAKSMLVILPAVLLIMDWWPLGRLPEVDGTVGKEKRSVPGLVIEKLPLFILSGISVAFSLLSHPKEPLDETAMAPLGSRTAHAVISYFDYPARLFWPSGHAIFYEVPQGFAAGHLLAAIIVLAGCSIAALVYRRRIPWFTAGWFWYLCALFPVSGVVRVGRWPGMADRFTYLPFVGLFIILAWFGVWLGNRWTRVRPLIGFVVIVSLILLAVSTYRQTAFWLNSLTLFEESARVAPGANSYSLLGQTLFEMGDRKRAAEYFERALALKPFFEDANFGLGKIYLMEGKPGQALPHLKLAAVSLPLDHRVQNNLGSALLEMAQPHEALSPLEKAVSLKPDYPDAHYNLGLALLGVDRISEAAGQFRAAVRFDPSFLDARVNLSWTLLKTGDVDGAISELEYVLARRPEDATAHINLGLAYEEKGDALRSAEEYRKALIVRPSDPDARKGLARTMKGLRK